MQILLRNFKTNNEPIRMNQYRNYNFLKSSSVEKIVNLGKQNTKMLNAIILITLLLRISQ